MNLINYAQEHGFKEGDKIILDGKIISRLDLQEQRFNNKGEPIPFDTPRYRCPVCHNKILKLPIVYLKDKKYVISGELVFHCWDTHGIPIELVDELLGISKMVELYG